MSSTRSIKNKAMSYDESNIDWWIQFIEISNIIWTKLMILIGIFRIIVLVSPQSISVKIVQKINYIWINFDIGFLNDWHQKFNSKIDSDIINFLNNFDTCWLQWNYESNAKNSYLNHQFCAQNIRYFEKFNVIMSLDLFAFGVDHILALG